VSLIQRVYLAVEVVFLLVLYIPPPTILLVDIMILLCTLYTVSHYFIKRTFIQSFQQTSDLFQLEGLVDLKKKTDIEMEKNK